MKGEYIFPSERVDHWFDRMFLIMNPNKTRGINENVTNSHSASFCCEELDSP